MRSDIKTEVTKILTVELDERELESLVSEYVQQKFSEFDGQFEIEWDIFAGEHVRGVKVRATKSNGY